MREKLKSGSGVTIAEVLLAVLIMSLLTLAVAAGSGTAAKVYRAEKEYSESRVLANSALLTIIEELRYGSDVTVADDGSFVIYDSQVYGADTRLELSAGTGGILKITYGAAKTAYPLEEKAYLGYVIRPRTGKKLFAPPAAGSGEPYVEIAFEVARPDGSGAKAAIESVKIRLLNGKAETERISGP